MEDIWSTITNSFSNSIESSINYIPQILAAAIIIIVGLFAGKFIGKVFTKILDKIGFDKALGKTALGSMIKTTNMSISKFIDTIIRWFVYLVFIVAAVDVLDLAVLSEMIKDIIGYLPKLFSGLIVFVGGLVIVDVIADWIGAFVTDMKIGGAKQVMIALRGFMFLLIAILTLDQLGIDTTIFYTFVSPMAWAFAVIIAFRYGVKDALIEYAKEQRKK